MRDSNDEFPTFKKNPISIVKINDKLSPYPMVLQAYFDNHTDYFVVAVASVPMGSHANLGRTDFLQ